MGILKKIYHFLSGKSYQVSYSECPDILESDGKPMKCLEKVVFQNWGRTVENTPHLTCFPRTKIGVTNLVKYAKKQQKRVRVSGYRHTWSSLYSNDGEILISLLPLNIVNNLPGKKAKIDPNNELQKAPEVVGTIREAGMEKGLVRMGPAITNEQIREWSIKSAQNDNGHPGWTLPLNSILVDNTISGVVSNMCHGGGWNNPTVSDLVAELEFVDANGTLQTISDPNYLKAAAGCFGLLGIITSITVKFDPMSYALLKPLKKKTILAIPPPAHLISSQDLTREGVSQDDLDQAWEDFVRRIEDSYYAEWFWFPYQKKCWINTWENDGQRKKRRNYPSPWGIFWQQSVEYIAQLSILTFLKWFPTKSVIKFIGKMVMSTLPSSTEITTYLTDGLHFRRGIHNMRALDFELEVPIPSQKEDPSKPDWHIVQDLWWAVINDLAKREDAPMRVTLEMRIMSNSQITMAPQYGNTHGTCSIEVLTFFNENHTEWNQFLQEILDKWMAIAKRYDSDLNVRPHWAKHWQSLEFNGMPAVNYLKEIAFKKQISIFKEELQQIAHAKGFKLSDCKQLFSNDLLNRVFEEVFVED